MGNGREIVCDLGADAICSAVILPALAGAAHMAGRDVHAEVVPDALDNLGQTARARLAALDAFRFPLLRVSVAGVAQRVHILRRGVVQVDHGVTLHDLVQNRCACRVGRDEIAVVEVDLFRDDPAVLPADVPHVRAGKLHAPLAADAPPREFETVAGERGLLALVQNGVPDFLTAVLLDGAVCAEAAQYAVNLIRSNDAAEILPPVAGEDAHDARVVLREPVPDGKQGAGQQVQGACVVLRDFCDLLFPCRAPLVLGNGLCLLFKRCFDEGAEFVLDRGFQLIAPLDFASVEVGYGADLIDRPHAAVVEAYNALEVLVRLCDLAERCNNWLAVRRHLDVFCVCAGGVRSDNLFVYNLDLVRTVVFKAHIDGAARNRLRHEAVERVIEALEDFILLVHFEGKNAVEEFPHIAQGVGFVVELAELVVNLIVESEAFQRLRVDFSVISRKGVLCNRVFEVVFFAKNAASGLPLPLGERAELVEAPRDGGSKALLSHDVCGNEAEDGRACLIAAVRSTEALHRLARLPSGL